MRLTMKRTGLAALFTVFFITACDDGSFADVASQKGGFDESQTKAIEQIMRNYLLKNPEIIREVISELEKKETAQQALKQKQALVANADKLFKSNYSPVAGNTSGNVSIVEFFDYNCPYCKKAFSDLKTLLDKDKNVRVVFKEFPIFGGDSLVAARAALAAKKQGKYFEFHQALLETKGRVTKNKVFKAAEDLRLDIDKLKADMKADDIDKEIEEARKLADDLGVQGTPAFFIGDKMVPGAPEDLLDVLTDHVAEIRKNGCAVC